MKSIHDLLRKRLHDRAGLTEPPKPKYSLEQLAKTEWSPEFEQLMRNRLLMGALRYGPIKDNCKGTAYLIKRIKRSLDTYEKTGNIEMLVDIANFCLVDFVVGNHPTRHFEAIDRAPSSSQKLPASASSQCSPCRAPLQFRWQLPPGHPQ